MKAKSLSWSEHLQRQSSSDLTVSAYCERYRLSPSMFYYHKRKLSLKSVAQPLPFKEVEILRQRLGPVVFEVHLAEHAVIRIEGNVSPLFLRELAGC
jgi:hypothetical protein